MHKLDYARVPGQIAVQGRFQPSGCGKRADRPGLTRADLDQRCACGGQQRGQLGQQTAIGIEAVWSGE